MIFFFSQWGEGDRGREREREREWERGREGERDRERERERARNREMCTMGEWVKGDWRMTLYSHVANYSFQRQKFDNDFNKSCDFVHIYLDICL